MTLPGEEFNLIFEQSRAEQLTRLQEQVKQLAVPPTTDDLLDIALSEIEYTIHIIREKIFFDETNHNRTRIPQSPNTLEDII